MTPSISVFRSPNVCLPLPWSARSPLFWLYCGLFGIGLECPLLFAPLDHLWWLYCGFLGSELVLLERVSSFSLLPSVTFSGCTVVFLALSLFCLSVRVFLLFAPLGRLFWFHRCFFEKGLSECGSIVYALSCLICK